jgi:hypothetical protein
MNGRAANGTEVRQLLCRRSTCGNVPCGTSTGGSEGERLGRRSRWNQDTYASACGRGLNGLVAQMADGAVV